MIARLIKCPAVSCVYVCACSLSSLLLLWVKSWTWKQCENTSGCSLGKLTSIRGHSAVSYCDTLVCNYRSHCSCMKHVCTCRHDHTVTSCFIVPTMRHVVTSFFFACEYKALKHHKSTVCVKNTHKNINEMHSSVVHMQAECSLMLPWRCIFNSYHFWLCLPNQCGTSHYIHHMTKP